MKTVAQFLSFLIGIVMLISCSEKGYNNQPWMPHKAKNSSSSGHARHAHSHHKHSNNF